VGHDCEPDRELDLVLDPVEEIGCEHLSPSRVDENEAAAVLNNKAVRGNLAAVRENEVGGVDPNPGTEEA
jgi:hypothetical protein